MSLLEITDFEFEQELSSSDLPVLAYFWADWCGPCRLVSPSIAAIADQYGDRLKIFKLAIDPNPTTVAKYQVEGVPAFRLFKAGMLVASHEGAITKPKLLAWLESSLV